jgi:hypothetical protein
MVTSVFQDCNLLWISIKESIFAFWLWFSVFLLAYPDSSEPILD